MEMIYKESIRVSKDWIVKWAKSNKMMKHFKMKGRFNGKKNHDCKGFNNIK
jgi:hypothetical protein